MFAVVVAAALAHAAHTRPAAGSPPLALVLRGPASPGQSWVQGDERITIDSVRHERALVDVKDLPSGDVSTVVALASPDPWTGAGPAIFFDGTTLCIANSIAGLCNPVTGAQTFSGAVTFSASGTAVTVSHNASIGGNLTLSASGGANLNATSSTNPLSVNSSNAASDGAGITLSASSLTASAANKSGGVLQLAQPTASNTNLISVLDSGTSCSSAQCFATWQAAAAGTQTLTINTTTSTDGFIVDNPNVGTTCTGSNAILKIEKGESPQFTVKCSGDVSTATGNISSGSNASGSGEFMTGGANKVTGAAGSGDLVIGGGNTSSSAGNGVTNGDCATSAGCGGHIHQAAFFSENTSTGAAAIGACPFVCEIDSSTTAPTSIQVTFIQSFTNKPWCDLEDVDKGRGMSYTGVTYTGSPITSVKYTGIAGDSATDHFISVCIGNGA